MLNFRHKAVQAGLGTAAMAFVATAFVAGGSAEQVSAAAPGALDVQALCSQASVQAIASTITSSKVTVKEVGNGPFKSATRYVAADGKLPAYCQVTGTFVTNPKTGKTANFLGTFPANWNGKYLQSGCSGHCGQFYVSNPATPSVTVTAQGWPGQIIERGYAHFATDEGHEMGQQADWSIRKDGTVDHDAVEDFFYRADLVLSKMGKQFATAFYGKAKGAPQKISYSYLNGCSGGGRDAFVAISYFPDAFDGIIGGSAYNMMGTVMHGAGIGLAAGRPGARITPALRTRFDQLVKAQCDAVDGVKDGVIQNPAACNFVPERDLPRCADDKPGDQCFTKGQAEAFSTIVTAVTDEKGTVVQPGYSVSELNAGGGPGGGGQDAVQKAWVYNNDPNFNAGSYYTLRSGGPGQASAFRATVPSSYVAKGKAALKMGIGHYVENTGPFMKSKTKFLIWHNWSDEALTPYMSVNWYNEMAKKYGGYAKLERNTRMFMIPATAHCSITGIGPNSFDAMGAIEDWVERGKAPVALTASVMHRQYSPGAPQAAAMKFPNWTQLLCKYPIMARYSGNGDVKDAKNWSCPAGDKSMLKIGDTGRQAGMIAY